MSSRFKDNFSDSSGSGPFNADPDPYLSSRLGLIRCPDCGLEVASSARVCPNDGSDLFLKKGEVFADKYELLEVIGSGAMGIIYRAKHLILDKIVAIKVLHTATASENLLMRFQREARAASSLSHSNVITIYDFGLVDDTVPYMVMDFLDGENLADYLHRVGTPISVEESVEIIEEVASALSHAHKKGVLHRDLKPSNIMLVEEEGEPRSIKILDFGLAKLIDAQGEANLSASGAALGSPAYMSPEQSTGRTVDGRTDIYSLGCIFYEFLTGAPPLIAEMPMQTLMNRLNDPVPSINNQRGGEFPYPEELVSLVDLMLRKEPDERPSSIDEFRRVLSSLRSVIEKWRSDFNAANAGKKIKPSQIDPRSSRTTIKDIAVVDTSEHLKIPRERDSASKAEDGSPKTGDGSSTTQDSSPKRHESASKRHDSNPKEHDGAPKEHSRVKVERPARTSLTNLKSLGKSHSDYPGSGDRNSCPNRTRGEANQSVSDSLLNAKTVQMPIPDVENSSNSQNLQDHPQELSAFDDEDCVDDLEDSDLEIYPGIFKNRASMNELPNVLIWLSLVLAIAFAVVLFLIVR